MANQDLAKTDGVEGRARGVPIVEGHPSILSFSLEIRLAH